MPLSGNIVAQYCDESQYAIAGTAAGFSNDPTMLSSILYIFIFVTTISKQAAPE